MAIVKRKAERRLRAVAPAHELVVELWRYATRHTGNMTPLRSAFQKEIEDNIGYGEAVFAVLKRKAERQLEIIAPAREENVIEFWRASSICRPFGPSSVESGTGCP